MLKKRKMPIRILNGEIHALNQERQSAQLRFSKKIEIIGNIISVSMRMQNPSNFFIKNVIMSFIAPPAMEFIREDSDKKIIEISELDPNSVKIYAWKFRVNRPKEDKGYIVNKFQLEMKYQDLTNEEITIRKEIELIL
jgi:hypothetical protein